MRKRQLKSLIKQCLSTREIARRTNKSQTTVRYWLNYYGLKTRIQPFNRGGKLKLHFCEWCGESDPKRFYNRKNRCKNCHNDKQKEYVKSLKRKAVLFKGGKCKQCGYCKNLAALDFHHIDSTQKDENWITARHWGWKRLKKELEKCDLVCRNCHAEIHYPGHKM